MTLNGTLKQLKARHAMIAMVIGCGLRRASTKPGAFGATRCAE
jgi:hypothetical protein